MRTKLRTKMQILQQSYVLLELTQKPREKDSIPRRSLVLTPLWYAMQKNKRLTPPSCLQHDNAEEDKTCFKWKVVQWGNKDIHCTVSKRSINRLGSSFNFFRFLKWKRYNSVALLKTLCSRLPGHTTGSGAALLTHQHFFRKIQVRLRSC